LKFKRYFKCFDELLDPLRLLAFLKLRTPAQSGLHNLQMLHCGAANDLVAERLVLGLNLM
jgi:hypothetical protein